MRTLTVAGVALAVLVLPQAGCGWSDYYSQKAQKVLNVHEGHMAGSGLDIRTRNGTVKVIAEPGREDVAIEATIKTRGHTIEEAEQRLAQSELSVTRDVDRTLAIKPVFPEPYHSGEGASFDIRVPDAHGVYIDTANGSVMVTGLSGPLIVDTSNGSVEIAGHEGSARVHTSNGAIDATDHVGELTLDTSNGPIHLENIDGSVSGDTSNGWIWVSLADDQAGPMHLDTSNGSIRVRVGPAFAGRVRMGTSNGWISVTDEVGRVASKTVEGDKGHVVIGDGGEPSRLGTSNGNIRLTIGG